MKLSDFMKRMERHIMDKPARCEVAEEIKNHIMEQKEAYIKAGLPPTEAEDMAVEQMGDPDEIGRMMNKVYRPKWEWKALFYIAFWMVFIFVGRLMYTLTLDYIEPFRMEYIYTMYAPFDVFRYTGYLLVTTGFFLSLYEKYAGLPFFNAISNWQGAGALYNGCALCGIGLGCIAHSPIQLVTIGIPVIAVMGIQREYISALRRNREEEYLWRVGTAKSDIDYKGTAKFGGEIKKVQISKGDAIKKGTPVIVIGLGASVLIVEPAGSGRIQPEKEALEKNYSKH